MTEPWGFWPSHCRYSGEGSDRYFVYSCLPAAQSTSEKTGYADETMSGGRTAWSDYCFWLLCFRLQEVLRGTDDLYSVRHTPLMLETVSSAWCNKFTLFLSRCQCLSETPA